MTLCIFSILLLHVCIHCTNCFFVKSILWLSVYEIMFNPFYTNILPADS